jgi:N-acetylglucosaminyldiphosphoundecaprenol N-acetyl-beta-D-mannosaminyltransferase
MCEVVVALTGLVFLSFPVFISLAVRKLLRGKKIFTKEMIIGTDGQPTAVYFFKTEIKALASLALIYSILKGDLTFVGGSLVKCEENESKPENNYLQSIKPGLFSLWGLRFRSKTAHEGRLLTEWEYCFTKKRSSDTFILLRSIPVSLMGGADQKSPSTVAVFDVAFENVTMREAVTRIEADLDSANTVRSIFYVNADCLNKCYRDEVYRSLLKESDYVLPDGIGINLACRMLGSALKENVNGTDMLPFLCEMAKRRGLKFFLLGGKPGVADKMAAMMTESYEVEVAGVQHGYFDHQNESDDVVDLINESGADILLVAFGAPLQEKWISTHKQRLTVGTAFGVGGLFDFYSGNTRRAPRWLRELGLEWVYRIIQEPGRMWQRYVIGNPLFLIRVMAWRARNRSNRGE